MHPEEIDKYLILKHLGSGQFGDVYLAEDRVLEAKKAIKILSVKNPDLFLNQLEEARILHQCRHKHIVKVNEANIYSVDDQPKIVIDMEYLPNGSLEDCLHRNEISIHQISRLIIQILFALEHAHNQGILHRDVKPGNIMLGSSGAKLSDFGLATFLGSDKANSHEGYITHLPPEYFDESPATEHFDIYAIGMTFFRVSCGYMKWLDIVKTQREPMQKIKDGKLIQSIGYPRYVPSTLRRIINKACHPDVTKRFQTAAEMRQALERLRPRIDWKAVNELNWSGQCRQTDNSYLACINKCRKGYIVDIKRNGRRISDERRCLSCKDEAIQYIETYVANSIY